MNKIYDDIDKAEIEMKKVSDEIKSRIQIGDERGAWQKQLELNEIHDKWRKILIDFFKDIKDNPNFYKPK